MPGPILIVDDDPMIRATVPRMLAQAGHETETASSALEALERLEHESFALIVTDVSMPEMTGLELLERLQRIEDAPHAIVLSGEGTIDAAVRAVQLGALDFLTKPVRRERLVITVDSALRYARLAEVNEHLRASVTAATHLVGNSRGMRRLRALVAKVAPSEGRVLILGENGTGKELVAAAIHAGSERRDGPFVKLNCAAVPENLVESELFGHEAGAFSGAVATRKGRFELADGGTLFLDEIGDMPAPMQAKLLRVLQEGTFERVGGSRTIRVRVRVIAATNRDMEELVAEGTFREDLLYRLNVVTIEIPPLRERSDDITELVGHFLSTAGPNNGRRSLALTNGALEALRGYPFPGNVRELSNLVERVAILAERDVVDAEDLAMLLPRRRRKGQAGAGSAPAYQRGATLKEHLRGAEREILVAAIGAHDGKKADAAKALEVERSNFYKKCRQLNIE